MRVAFLGILAAACARSPHGWEGTIEGHVRFRDGQPGHVRAAVSGGGALDHASVRVRGGDHVTVDYDEGETASRCRETRAGWSEPIEPFDGVCRPTAR